MEDMALDDTFKNTGFLIYVTTIVCLFPQLQPLRAGAVYWVGCINMIYEPTGSDERNLSDKIMPIWKLLVAYSILSAGDTIRVWGMICIIGGEKSRNKKITTCVLCVYNILNDTFEGGLSKHVMF